MQELYLDCTTNAPFVFISNQLIIPLSDAVYSRCLTLRYKTHEKWNAISIYVNRSCLYSLLLDIGGFFRFLILYKMSRTPWTGVSPSQGRYLYTEQHKHINVLSGIRTHCPPFEGAKTLHQFMLLIVRPLWSARVEIAGTLSQSSWLNNILQRQMYLFSVKFLWCCMGRVEWNWRFVVEHCC
jgi:hypothetical protein